MRRMRKRSDSNKVGSILRPASAFSGYCTLGLDSYLLFAVVRLDIEVRMSEGGSSGGGNKLTNIRTTVRSILREKNCFTYVFELAEKYTKVDREYLFWGK